MSSIQVPDATVTVRTTTHVIEVTAERVLRAEGDVFRYNVLISERGARPSTAPLCGMSAVAAAEYVEHLTGETIHTARAIVAAALTLGNLVTSLASGQVQS